MYLTSLMHTIFSLDFITSSIRRNISRKQEQWSNRRGEGLGLQGDFWPARHVELVLTLHMDQQTKGCLLISRGVPDACVPCPATVL